MICLGLVCLHEWLVQAVGQVHSPEAATELAGGERQAIEEAARRRRSWHARDDAAQLRVAKWTSRGLSDGRGFDMHDTSRKEAGVG